jgi:hypothetical protein
MTIDDDRKKGLRGSSGQTGVFLSSRRNAYDERDEFRMSLLWHSEADTLGEGSAMFGRLLQVRSDFRNWRDNPDEQADAFEYFSSNSCKVGDYVSGSAHPDFDLVCVFDN